jgi:hypothetical protein
MDEGIMGKISTPTERFQLVPLTQCVRNDIQIRLMVSIIDVQRCQSRIITWKGTNYGYFKLHIIHTQHEMFDTGPEEKTKI